MGPKTKKRDRALKESSDEKWPSYAHLSGSWPILGRNLAILAAFFKILI